MDEIPLLINPTLENPTNRKILGILVLVGVSPILIICCGIGVIVYHALGQVPRYSLEWFLLILYIVPLLVPFWSAYEVIPFMTGFSLRRKLAILWEQRKEVLEEIASEANEDGSESPPWKRFKKKLFNTLRNGPVMRRAPGGAKKPHIIYWGAIRLIAGGSIVIAITFIADVWIPSIRDGPSGDYGMGVLIFFVNFAIGVRRIIKGFLYLDRGQLTVDSITSSAQAKNRIDTAEIAGSLEIPENEVRTWLNIMIRKGIVTAGTSIIFDGKEKIIGEPEE